MKLSMILFALFAFTWQSAFAAPPGNWPRLKPGMIETKMKVNGETMPPTRMCITDAQMKESEKMSADHESKCANQKYRQSGNTHYMEMTCKDENGKPTRTTSEVTVISENEFRMKTTSTHNGKPMKMEQTTKRVGDCSAKEANAPVMPMGDDGKPIDMKELMEQMKKMRQQ